jgi:hypothetical protein
VVSRTEVLVPQPLRTYQSLRVSALGRSWEGSDVPAPAFPREGGAAGGCEACRFRPFCLVAVSHERTPLARMLPRVMGSIRF